MRSLSIFNRRAGSVFAAAALVLSTAVPGLASAATVTQRSIALSSSTKGATDVSYHVKFTTGEATSSTGAFILDFCDTAAVGTTCANAAGSSGIDVTDVATVAGNTVSDVDTNTAKVVLGTPVTAGNDVDIVLTGIDNPNPTNAGVFYARIVSYANDTDATAYASDDIDNGGTNNHLDQGTVALSTTNGFSVGGSVAETMTFCASGAAINDNCVTTSPANLSLGASGVLSTTASTGTVYTKISTNAVGGAVVSLKSDALGCGGLVRDGGADDDDAGCGITPIATPAATIADDASEFGMVLALTGLTVGTNWSTTNYSMDFVDGDATGVTSTYGSEIYNTNDAPADEATGNLTFGANIGNLTPAGSYEANFSLIATGKF